MSEPVWRILRQVQINMFACAQQCLPNEACGLLIGKKGMVEQFVPVPNSAENPLNSFAMQPAALIAALRDCREQGVQVVGVMHSHPTTQAVPSARDVAECSHHDWLQVIVSLARPGVLDMRAWQLSSKNPPCEVKLLWK